MKKAGSFTLDYTMRVKEITLADKTYLFRQPVELPAGAYNVFIDNRKTTRHTEDIEGYDYIQDNNQSTTTVMDIQNGLKTLKENEKICIMLHYDNGFSHPEIADILNMPVGTVKTNILRGKEKLKKYFDYEQQ